MSAADNNEKSSVQGIYSKGIYRGLPDLSSASKGLTATVTGANGISGAHMVRVLAENSERWSKIYALSRRPPSGKWPDTVEHVPVDFLTTPQEIADILKSRGIKPDYVFFFSYVLIVDDDGALQWGDQRLLIRPTDELMSNFLEALPLANALPKRVFAQFGQKWYGVHLGATDIPDEESDDRLTLEPNLYYTQHDILESFCSKHGIGWNTALPSFVIGAAIDSSQSLLFPILAYACVQKYLGRELEYPSDLDAWYAPQSLSNAVLNSYLYEWSVLAPNTANQAFNASDDCQFTWGKMWPRLASYFDMDYIGPDDGSAAKFQEQGMKCDPPPHGRGRRSMMRFKFSFVEWAKSSENVQAWKELSEKHGLRDAEWKDVGSIFGRANFCLHRPYASVMSATKAKKFGFFGFVDSYESIFSVIEEFVALKIVPDPNSIKPR
ncbi:NAD dependent epimerase/dehydratase family protein-like protein [Neohortaea acidophila]|uniref:NAD dependent epimerase/dehydratase family protein-like protein n=1 Tax=Neohortaea acidophila TaxID=245834 RepID=A0A6A6PFH5_9PEZI|nr:NAD dependent epimerase/dehydratase family protein-like protein [Neohortaea acidophila]KAF2478710.1 NAD dependent epimerase/dehydratase family protein-like protein [Neohortaea acidophila]